MNKAVLVTVLGGGAVVVYLLFRSKTASASGLPDNCDEYGNPEGTQYDDFGRPYPPAHEEWAWTQEQGITEMEEEGLRIQWAQRDRTQPAPEGGLRAASDGAYLDGRVALYGRLMYPLGAHDREIYVGNPDEEHNPNRWTTGNYYRLTVEGEEMLARCLGKLGSRRGIGFQILERPQMHNWQSRASSRAYRDPVYDDSGNDIWPQYSNVTDPVYGEGGFWGCTRSQAWADGVLIPGGDPIWVSEIRGNCDRANHWIWDARANACREMTADEAAAYDAAVDWFEQQAEAEEEGNAAQRNAWSQQYMGISYDDYVNYRDYWQRPDKPGYDEVRARNQAILERTTLTQPGDLYVYAPQYATGGNREVPFPRGNPHDGTLENHDVRRERGRQRYERLNPIMKREFLRDFYAVGRGDPQSGYGKAGIIGVGGFYALCAIWGAPSQPEVSLATTPAQISTTTPATISLVRRIAT